MVMVALLDDGGCSIYRASHVIKMKLDIITALNVADLLH